MKFEEVLPALRDGKKVKRAAWTPLIDYICCPYQGSVLVFDGSYAHYVLTHSDLCGQDWEIVE
jgi:hypothetical protein